MQDKIIAICGKVIEYLFYALFAFVPLFFLPINYELFEFNKMVLTYGITILIGLAWGLKMILGGKISVQRTPLDIPILLFLTSQIISTIVSIDIHTSVWGYYSRSNGGLVSIISYIFLYYAFVSNFPKDKLNRLFFVMLGSGVLVAIYGVLERLGIDKDYWVQDVQNRVFSTLGQPNWLAAYLSVLIPISLAFAIAKIKNKFLTITFSLVTLLFYTTLLFTKSRSGVAGLGIGLAFLFIYLWKTQKSFLVANKQFFIGIFVFFAVLTFIFGTPFEQVNKFTLPGIQRQTTNDQRLTPKPQGPALEGGGTESGKIRQIVWKGAIDIAKAYPLFGSGVETFAYSYYLFRPAEHNQTSEWDFLYNKAHNEYLNYLANTGFIGLAAYLFMIVMFFKNVILSKAKDLSRMRVSNKLRDSSATPQNDTLTLALVAGYLSILVSNFFGFSVVIVNLFFFLIPAFVFVLNGEINSKKALGFSFGKNLSKAFLLVLIVIWYLLIVYVAHMWNADRMYALGRGLNRAGEFSEAYPFLVAAIKERPGEPIFSEELSTNIAALAIAAEEQNESSLSAQLITESIRQSDYTIRKGPNNPGFWRTRIRVFYTLSQLDEKYTQDAEEAAKRTVELSPTDPKIIYNYGLILGQSGKLDEAIVQLERAHMLKPDYRDPVYALGLFYYEKATDNRGAILDQELLNKAITQMEQVLKFASDDAEATEKLKKWRGF